MLNAFNGEQTASVWDSLAGLIQICEVITMFLWKWHWSWVHTFQVSAGVSANLGADFATLSFYVEGVVRGLEYLRRLFCTRERWIHLHRALNCWIEKNEGGASGFVAHVSVGSCQMNEGTAVSRVQGHHCALFRSFTHKTGQVTLWH